jgi:hypothetical protein
MSLPILIAVLFVGSALYGTFDSWRRLRGVRRLVGILGGILLVTGGGAFFSSGFSSAIPTSFEWPVGHASQIIQLPNGQQVAVHESSGRLQVYDSQWHFIRGWAVNAGGGLFKVRLTEAGLLEVWTARGQKRLIFDPAGRLIEAGSYESRSYGDLPTDGKSGGKSGYVPTPLPLWIFANPFIAWSVGAVGMAMSVWSDPEKSKRFKRMWGH